MNLVCVSGMTDASASGGAGQVPTQRGERERSPTRAPTTQKQQQPAQGPQRFRMNSPEGGQGLPGGATAPYASIPPPPPKAASGCGSMPGSPTGQQEVFSTAQMTQIAQIVSLSLNQAMGEFNMRLNSLQQQVVHQQCVCSGTGAASCITTGSGTSCEDITFYLKWFVIIWRSSTHQSTTQFSKEHCGTATRFAAVASETDQ